MSDGLPSARRFALTVFDMDGVLVATSPCHERAYQDLWLELGLAAPDYESIAGQRTIDVVRTVTAPLAPTAEDVLAWTKLKQERARRYIDETEIAYPDTRSSLQTLARLRQPLALATGASRQTVDQVLHHLGVGALFPVIVTAEDVRSGKPSPEVFSTAFLRAGVEPQDVLVVEDSLSGLQAALAAGANCISVRTGISLDAGRFLGAFDDLESMLGMFKADAT